MRRAANLADRLVGRTACRTRDPSTGPVGVDLVLVFGDRGAGIGGVSVDGVTASGSTGILLSSKLTLCSASSNVPCRVVTSCSFNILGTSSGVKQALDLLAGTGLVTTAYQDD